jgi:hypothetical protein
MRLTGADSVGYHERTVLDRGDDPVSNALDYYGSRGETPTEWGGAGAASLGLQGEVSVDEWRAVFGTGGARHPENGERLVHCMRPGMELVVSSAKTSSPAASPSPLTGPRGPPWRSPMPWRTGVAGSWPTWP